MSRKIELQIDVSDSVPLPGPLLMAATVTVPAEGPTNPAIVVFALPGGGYCRRYFDMHFANHHNYSQADYHAQRGKVFVALDHLGVGDSTIPDLRKLTIEHLAAATDAAVEHISDRLRTGTVCADLPPMPAFVKIGIGQSMGGCITIVTQGRHRTYDAIAPLGYSAIHTVLPQKSREFIGPAMRFHQFPRGFDLTKLSLPEAAQTHADYLYPFHWDDVPADILEADLAGGYPVRKTAPAWGSTTLPLCAIQMMSPRAVAQEAALITVPVLVAAGERDVLPARHAEASAYSGSDDVGLFIVPRMAHMHNFASTREILWRRLDAWVELVAEGGLSSTG